MVNECLQMYNNEQYMSNFTNNHYRKERSMTLSGSSSDSNNNNNTSFKSTNSHNNRRQNTRQHQSSSNSQKPFPNANNPYDFHQNFTNSNIHTNSSGIPRSYTHRHTDPAVMNVFADNLVEGMKKLREFSKCSRVVAIDTEFPGVIVKLHHEYTNMLDHQYSNVKMNNDLLKPIQIGFSFFDEKGNPMGDYSTVQFNFKWSMAKDMGNNESLELLKRSGIDFNQLESNGIDPELFGELFMISGLVNNENLTWVGFHCNHDWAYILKIITGWKEMPIKFGDFSKLLQIYFPKTIDLKTLVIMKQIPNCGLQDLSYMLKVKRHGCQHQAGSDSRLTGDSYFKFIAQYFDREIKPDWYNLIFGMNYSASSSTNFQPVQSPDDRFENSSTGSSRSSPFSGNATPDEESNSNNDESN